MYAQNGGKIFTIKVMTRDMDEFRRYAETAARLKPYGRVAVDVCNQAEPTPYGLPPGGNAWHDYLVWHETLIKFFPHPKLVPHLSKEQKNHTEKNRKLLLSKVKVLDELGLEAFFRAVEPFFWPESFFEEHPHLRGPRIDHPRRSIREEFAPCTDLPEVQEMFEWMMAELKKNVPMLSSLTIHINDAGSGLCWHSALYPGMHGPDHCRNIDPGVRVQKFIETLKKGAEKSGGNVRIGITGNFWNNECYTIEPKLPKDTFLHHYKSSAVNVCGMSKEPIRELINPAAVIAGMDKFFDPAVKELFLVFHAINFPGCETPETIGRVVDIVEDCIKNPAPTLREKQNKLYSLCKRWGGAKNADVVYVAFSSFDETDRFLPAGSHFGLAPTYGARANRHIVRPLVIKPDLLTPEEEAYFLPYIFNVSENEARMDYLDMHGGRWNINPLLRQSAKALVPVAEKFEAVKNAPEAEFFKNFALAIRIWASVIRSACNFHDGQMIRERNAEVLAGPGRVPEKKGSSHGDPDNLPWNELMRDELDNAAELLAILERGGRELVCCAEKAGEEMSFALTPDLAGALRKKMKIMRDHWRDVEKYLAPPHK